MVNIVIFYSIYSYLCRYERNVAKCAEKEYAYREKTEEQKEELDIVEFFTQMSYENEVLPADDVCLLLNMGASSAKTLEVEAKEAEARYNMALIWIRHLLTTLHKLRPEYRNSSLSQFSCNTKIFFQCPIFKWPNGCLTEKSLPLEFWMYIDLHQQPNLERQ